MMNIKRRLFPNVSIDSRWRLVCGSRSIQKEAAPSVSAARPEDVVVLGGWQ